MGRNKKIRLDDEEIDYDAIPNHLEPDNDESELNHYVEGKKIKQTTKRKYAIKKVKK